MSNEEAPWTADRGMLPAGFWQDRQGDKLESDGMRLRYWNETFQDWNGWMRSEQTSALIRRYAPFIGIADPSKRRRPASEWLRLFPPGSRWTSREHPWLIGKVWLAVAGGLVDEEDRHRELHAWETWSAECLRTFKRVADVPPAEESREDRLRRQFPAGSRWHVPGNGTPAWTATHDGLTAHCTYRWNELTDRELSYLVRIEDAPASSGPVSGADGEPCRRFCAEEVLGRDMAPLNAEFRRQQRRRIDAVARRAPQPLGIQLNGGCILVANVSVRRRTILDD